MRAHRKSVSSICSADKALSSNDRTFPGRLAFRQAAGSQMDLFARLTPRQICSSPLLRVRCKNEEGNEPPTDWDKAWAKFKKNSRKSLFSSRFDVDKYVTWNPRRSVFPLSEEVDPIRKTERSNLSLWTSPQFTLFGAIIIVSFLLVYTLLAPPPK